MYKFDELKSGLRVLFAPMPGANTVTFLLTVGTGSKYENRANNGISHFLEHMMFKGTKKYPTPLALSSAIDALGSEFNAFTGKEYTGYYLKVDKKMAVQAGEILADMLTGSKFAAPEFEREKGVIVEEINMYEDNPMMYIEDVFEQCLYGDTAAGWDVAGNKENVRSMKQGELVEYFKNQYQVNNSLLVVAGDLSVIKKAALEKTFGQFAVKHSPKKFIAKAKVAVSQPGAQLKLNYKKTDQAHLSLGVPTVASGDKKEMAVRMIAIILGGSMSSRLFTELREKRGLGYYVHTMAESYTDAGYLTTQAGVPVDKVGEAIRTILAEYKKMAKTLVPAKELQRVKDMLTGKLALKLEGSDEVASWYSRQAILSLTQELEGGKPRKIYDPKEYLKAVNKITAEEIRDAAKEFFRTDKLNFAVIGPYKDEEEFTKLLKI